MVNYENGKIYKIEPIVEHEDGEIYIGSTTKVLLSQRMSKHRNSYDLWKNECGDFVTAFNLFEKYGLNNCKIVLLENVENCKSINDLRARESYHIKNKKCVNKIVPQRTSKEWREDNKDIIFKKKKLYRENNKEKLQINKREWYDKNVEYLKEYGKVYNENNKEKRKEYSKQWHAKNKEKMSEKVTCICGSICIQRGLKEHTKSIKHQSFIQNI